MKTITSDQVNATIAREMGWKKIGKMFPYPHRAWEEPNGEIFLQLPDFQGNIADAFLVVDKMREMGFDVEFYGYMVSDGHGWEALFHGVGKFGSKIADELPEAICVAALETKGYKVQE